MQTILGNRAWAVAHRGASAHAPQNTIPAFDRAMALPIQGIELDLQLTKDGVPVIYHNRNLAMVGGGPHQIHQLKLSQLMELDFGSWFSEAFQGARIPTLEQVLDRYATRTTLLLEIKAGYGRQAFNRDLILARKLVQAVRAKGLQELVMVLCFDARILREIHRLEPAIRCVWNLHRVFPFRGDVVGRDAFLFAYSVRLRALGSDFISHAHRIGKPVMAYTANTPGDMQRALAVGTDVVMSDEPALLIAEMERAGAVTI